MKCCLANYIIYRQARKIIEWEIRIKDNFYKKASQTYIDVQQKIKQLFKNMKKKLNTEISEVMVGVIIRNNE